MSEPVVVSAEHLTKRNRIGESEPYRALRDILASPARHLQRRRERAAERELIALDDISFELHRGDVLGLIGANGAGTSTLLKVLSRITEPSAGEVRLRGRVGSLLEVGTGFHPELTGRENIYLNGTILGMRKSEIDRRFEEIVAFAGVERFLDTPVKRYSSGMQVRLAFAVAAHLEPEILLVDEVLAVGDAEFQRKCLGKMQDVTQHGRTVVFVSHNLASVRSLCNRALVLERGRLLFDGETDEAVELYLGRGGGRHDGIIEGERLEQRLTKGKVYGPEPLFRCDRISILDEAGQPSTSFRSDEDVTVAVDYTILQPPTSLRLILALTDGNQVSVLRTETSDDPETAAALPRAAGSWRAEVTIPAGLFGDVRLDVNVSLVSEVQQVADYASVAELELHFAGHGENMRGKAYLRPRLQWRAAPVDALVAPK